MDQSNRIAEFDRFKAGEITVLVASDVAARGLDVKGVSHVINFDVPWQPDDYIHRIGRTGRAGMKGIAITLATREDGEAIAGIEKLTGLKLPRTDGETPAAEAVAEAPREERPARSRGRSRERSKERAPKPEQRAAAPRAPEPDQRAVAPKAPEPEMAAADVAEPYAPTVEPQMAGDAAGAWNGPVPSFLQFGAA
jgi:superfamily II DNA/RNA helicase